MEILPVLGIFIVSLIIDTRALDSQVLSSGGLTTLADFFDCSGKPSGNYGHPTIRCSSVYVTCDNGKAYERDCPNCQGPNCPDGHLYYSSSEDSCVDAARAGCGGPNTPTPTPPTTTTTTTTTTPTPTTTTDTPGDSCPNNCTQNGYCIWYNTCEGYEWFDPISGVWMGKWVKRVCPNNTFWLPTPGVGSGGMCVLFTDLPLYWQEQYKKDPLCFCPCYWEEYPNEQGRCGGKYLYWNRKHPHQHNLDREELECRGDLVFNPILETCDNCTSVAGGKYCKVSGSCGHLSALPPLPPKPSSG